MATRLTHVVADAVDPPGLARFWSTALGWDVTFEDEHESIIEPPEDDPAQAGQVLITFVPVPEAKMAKNRIHLDVASTSDEHQAELVARLEAHGAHRTDVGQGPEVTWVVMADPEDNELCVVSHRGQVGKDPASAFAGIGPVAAIVFDCEDPVALAPFWAAATGWDILGQDDKHVWLRAPSRTGPWLDMQRSTDPKTVKNRVHLDVSPYPDDDHQAEVARLESLGARRIDIGQGNVRWVVLADPQGNEFCVLTPR